MIDSPPLRSPATLEKPEDEGDRRIVRDSTFTRAVVDEILPIPLGRDMELSCLQFSPLIHAMLDKGDRFVPDGDPVFAEVARIRISLGDAVDMAMRILHQGILSGRVKGASVVATLSEWASELEVKEGSADDEA